MKKAKRLELVAEICLYGTTQTGAGYLARGKGLKEMLGTGEPVAMRTFSEAIWHAQHALREAGLTEGLVRIYAPGGERCAEIGIGAAITYGALAWKPAPMLVISAEALLAAAGKAAQQ